MANYYGVLQIHLIICKYACQITAGCPPLLQRDCRDGNVYLIVGLEGVAWLG